ncbi:heme lyase NrfEFG subunit NrfE [Pacificimonas flava]|uniref:Heme lyase NrfEFG subunit NrfE n=2 Tax=Pacificimonas TaxID=1960290 RepID=A0A219B4Z9_9SPHN|nr:MULTISPECIES: heme lyase CcmF/NrfE family subunit [Pacificimonas]MBZ6379552.1 heme lyase CcmF/NrfE family subunit [Pacificimonas aurantium]OWV33264.1 heme lyase NrfEFG subunit NrfE [Pacificimonas flava]
MIPELGHFALWLAAALALVQLIGGEVELRRKDDDAALRLLVPAAIGQALLCTGAFGALIWAFTVSDFSVLLVASHSHTEKPLLYKLTGAWANHEGSMLLWVTVLALFGLAAAARATGPGGRFRVRLIQTMGAIALGFYAYLLVSSNPFLRLDPAPVEGRGLNPLLQDPGLAFHPPLLYLGYVGMSATFAFAVAALLERQVTPAWGRAVRPWVLAAWSFLTAGIMLGSFWAYYELGWGGWWFWDPVENASLMPWLAATALFHSVGVLAARGALKNWTILLAVLAFSLSMVGTFIVRSGLLTSVHAFAVDPERGLFLLILLGIYVGGALILYALRASTVNEGARFRFVSREGALVVNNLILSAILGVVFIGTLYPVALEAISGERVSVGPPYYETALLPLIFVLLVLMAAGPFLKWRLADLRAVGARLLPAFVTAAVLALVAVLFGLRGVLAALGVAVAGWLGAASLLIVLGPRARRLSLSATGTALAHFGVAVTALGIAASAAGSIERTYPLAPGETARIADFEIRLDAVEPWAGPNYTSVRGLVSAAYDGNSELLAPERRAFVNPMQVTTETDILVRPSGNLYAVLGDGDGEGRWQVRLHWQPLVALIWIGGLIAAGGGVVAAFAGGKRRARERREAAA